MDKFDIRMGNVEKGVEKILTNDLPHMEAKLEKKIDDEGKRNRWQSMWGVALIAILVALFGSLILVGH